MNPENIVPGPGPGPIPGPKPLPENPLVGTSNANPGVQGGSRTGVGVSGNSYGGIDGSPASDGVMGWGQNGVHGSSGALGGSGVFGENYGGGVGVSGSGEVGVKGSSSSGNGVVGQTQSGSRSSAGVSGVNTGQGPGVYGSSTNLDGVQGVSSSSQHAGVSGSNNSGGYGVWASSNANHGVYGQSQSPSNGNAGVCGVNTAQGPGVYGSSANWDGVHGDSQSSQHAGVSGVNQAAGIGVYGASNGEAGHFEGNVTINGTLTHNGDCSVNGTLTVKTDVVLLAAGQDCAEQFELNEADQLEPGTVVVIDRNGALRESHTAYDRKVAGIVSGAGTCRPGIVLGRRPSKAHAATVALVGRVYCKVDAHYSPIDVGDLLVSSETPGHAMRAGDAMRAFGAVIGKSLESLEAGRGLIPILVALQ